MTLAPRMENITTPLTTFLRDLIAADGPITLERYMDIVLHHPEHGYYRQGNPLGAVGDFNTAPELSPMFGEMIGVWCVDAWQRIGSPSAFVLLELGPGLGSMLQAAFRYTQQFPAFHQAMQLRLLESNATLRAHQAEKLGAQQPIHIDKLDDLPELPTLAVANEFFDTIPLRQFIRNHFGWSERRVAFKDGRLQFCNKRHLRLPKDVPLSPAARQLKRGWMYETSPQAQAIFGHVAAHIARHGGAGLMIDYGYTFPPKAGTLDAICKHQFVDVFTAPGQADVTAGVDFSMLAEIATDKGVQAAPLINQGDFLQRMGIGLHAEILKQQVTDDVKAHLNRILRHLTSPSKMGKFKVLEIIKAANVD